LNFAEIIAAGQIPSEIENVLPPEGPFPVISPEFGRALARLIISIRPKSVLEFGAGVSSVVVALSLHSNGIGRLTTVEHAPQYSTASWERVRSITDVSAELFESPLRLRFTRHGLVYAYQSFDRVRQRGPFDFVLVDSPPGTIGRDTTLYQSLPYLAPGAILVLDDAARVQEATVIRRWLRAVPGLELVLWNKQFARGIAILRYSGVPKVKLSLRTLLGTCHDRWIYREAGRALRAHDC